MASSPLYPTKTCSKCGAVKPATAEHFRPTHKRGKAYLRNQCRDCSRIETRRAMREHYRANAEAGCQRQRRRRLEYGDEVRERDRNYYQRNRDKRSELSRQLWAKRDKEKARLELKAWRDRNPDKQRAISRRHAERLKADPERSDARREYRRRWSRENPEGAKARASRRRAKLIDAEGSFTRDDVRHILRLQRKRCYYCDAFLTLFHCDHFVPLARGGSNGPENIVLSCPSCNCSKGARLPWEWRPDCFEEGCQPR